MIRRFMTVGGFLAIALLLGRLTGFVREIVLAKYFGLTSAADTAVLLLTMPDLLVNLLLTGGLAAALVPEFKRLEPKEGFTLFAQSLCLVLLVFGLIAFVLTLFPTQTLALLAPGLSVATLSHAAPAMRLMVWSIPLTGLAGVVTAYLNAHERFVVAGLGTLIFNICIIALLILWPDRATLLIGLALGINVGALVRLASQLAAIRKNVAGFPLSWVSWLIGKGLLRRYGEALLASIVLLLLPVLARGYASTTTSGGIAAFSYASKLVELPLGISITIVATLYFPKLAERFVSSAGAAEAQAMWIQGLRLTLLLAVAIFLTCYHYADVLADTVFSRGRLSAESVAELGNLAAIGFLSLPLQGAIAMLTAGFNAQRRTHVPLVVNTLGVGLYFVLIKSQPFGGQLSSVMWMLVLTYALVCLGLWTCSRLPLWGRNGVMTGRIVAAVVATVAVFAVFVKLSDWLNLGGKMLLAWILISGAITLAVSVGLGYQKRLPMPLASTS